MIIVFEDALVDQLAPITLGRPAYAISCGSQRLVDWLSDFDSPVHGIVRPYLREIQAYDFPQLARALEGTPEAILLINARLIPSAANRTRLVEWWNRRQADQLENNQQQSQAATADAQQTGHAATSVAGPMTVKEIVPLDSQVTTVGGQVVAALVTGGKASCLLSALCNQSVDTIQDTLARELADVPLTSIPLDLFEWPHDVIRYHLQTIGDNLNDRLARDNYHEIADGVFTRADVRIAPGVAWETHAGPILLESKVRVGPGAFLQGPVHVQVGAKINEHAALKEGVSLGHTTKVGGEIEASIIEPFSNKQHYGYLGHSYVGSWVNLGAGTTNSDLKNTYGQINVDYGGRKIGTSMQFLGCFIGDYTRAAIQTSIFTGKMIGVCSTLYGTITSNVPSFVNYARQLGQETEVSLAAMTTTQRRMFARRNCAVLPCHVQLLRDLFQQTETERGRLPQMPLSL